MSVLQIVILDVQSNVVILKLAIMLVKSKYLLLSVLTSMIQHFNCWLGSIKTHQRSLLIFFLPPSESNVSQVDCLMENEIAPVFAVVPVEQNIQMSRGLFQ